MCRWPTRRRLGPNPKPTDRVGRRRRRLARHLAHGPGRLGDGVRLLIVCKSYVSGVLWDHLSDADPHRLPNSGLVDARGAIKPAFDRLRALREEHLK